MGALSPAAAVRPAAFARLTFTAWKVGAGVNYPLDIGAPETLQAAAEEACRRCQHKDKFHVFQRDEINKRGVLAKYSKLVQSASKGAVLE